MMHKHIGNGKVTKYIDEKITYYLSFSFFVGGFVAGFFIGGLT